MQTRQTKIGQIWLSTPVIAKFVIVQLRQIPSVLAVGKTAVALHHPDAWQQIVVHRADALEIPLVIIDTAPLASTISDITTHVQQTLSQWCGMDVTIDIAIVRVASPITQS